MRAPAGQPRPVGATLRAGAVPGALPSRRFENMSARLRRFGSRERPVLVMAQWPGGCQAWWVLAELEATGRADAAAFPALCAERASQSGLCRTCGATASIEQTNPPQSGNASQPEPRATRTKEREGRSEGGRERKEGGRKEGRREERRREGASERASQQRSFEGREEGGREGPSRTGRWRST